MRYEVTLGDKTFEVEVGDVDERPVIATVGGNRFEVWPEVELARPAAPSTASADSGAVAPVPAGVPNQPTPRMSRRTSGPKSGHAGDSRQVVYAPIPGVVLSVAVQAGDTVRAGQELCVLEAMKMKNIIHASHDGHIAGILVSAGQRVKHNDPLFEYASEPLPLT